MNNDDKTTYFINNIYCFRVDVKKIIFSVVQDEDIADDLTQTVFEKAWKGLATLENTDKPKPWVKGIIRNEIRNHLKRQKKNKEYTEENNDIELISDNNLKNIEEDILEAYIEKERRKYLVEALSRLDEQSHEIVVLHLVVELSLKQIAEDLNLNYGSTRVFYSRAIEKLRNLFLDIERGAI